MILDNNKFRQKSVDSLNHLSLRSYVPYNASKKETSAYQSIQPAQEKGPV